MYTGLAHKNREGRMETKNSRENGAGQGWWEGTMGNKASRIPLCEQLLCILELLCFSESQKINEIRNYSANGCS